MDGRANHSPASDDNSRRSAACGDLAQTSHSPSAHLKKGVMLNGQDKDLNQNFPSPTVGIVVANLPMDAKGDGDGTGEARKPTEEELLQKLEEANRMLEADEKSHVVRAAFSTTPGHSRKGSGSSIVSSTSSNSFYSPQNSNEADENASLAQGRKSFKIKPLSFGNKGNRQVLGKGSDDTDSKKRMSQGRRGSLQTSQNNLGSPDQNIDLTDDVFLGSSSETLWEVWGRIINDWDSVKKKPAFLKELVRKGIPHEFRGMAWQLILGVHDSPFKQEYAEHMKKTSPCEKLIRRDIARTFPDHEFFKVKDGFGQESLFNVMKAYSLHDREVGYCQGSGFIVGLLLMQMPEEDAFAVLVRLMQDFRLRELFKPSMAELGLCMFKLECLMQELLPTLLIHFQTQNFDTSMYASSWFLTLYVTSLPLSLARRIMDLFVSEGMEMIFRVGIAILQSCQEDLLALDMEGLLMYLQKDLRNRFEQEQDQENLLTTAYSIKYSHKKMKKLEKEYTALKTKENEDQIELRRLRTENRLLRQRIENLEKESATLADKLVQDQVTWAQEVEQSYALRNELSVTRQQLQETQKKLLDAEDIIGDIRKRTRIIEDAVHLDEAEECNMVKYLQEELIAVRLREAETACTIKELKLKISDLEDTNLRLQRAPSNDVQQLQEELIAVKLREAEANLSMKELHMKVNEIETYWESYMERVRQASPKEKSTKSELRHLQEEIMALKLKEARAVGDLKDAKQKLMELETQNQIFTNQIRRMGEDNKEMKRLLEESAEREKDLKVNIKDLTRKLDDTESKRREESMMSRIKEAENVQLLAELRHKIAEIDIQSGNLTFQKEELLAAGQLHDKGENQELENKLHDLQDEVLQLQLSFASSNRGKRCVMTDSYLGNNSDEELDAELKESENLDQTLSDIIEGRGLAAHAAPDVENQTQTSQSLSSLEGDEDTQLFSSHKDSVHENQCRESTDSGDSGFKGKSSAPQVKSNSDSLWELYEEVVVLDTNMEGRVVGRNSSNSAGCGDSDVYRGGNGRGVRQGSDERGEVGGRREEDRIPDVVIIYEPSCGLRTPNTDTKDFYLKESRV
ncbi:EVI5-like protein isoform X3 [Physella acuta]|uniref:EVI5-like protein isoform X3 n=1 Tax=Physella acuta TaxID=109671 RepID=UPI0027DACD5D|nr:EVI5-like protein isoform X3 [Physella acuta]